MRNTKLLTLILWIVVFTLWFTVGWYKLNPILVGMISGIGYIAFDRAVEWIGKR